MSDGILKIVISFLVRTLVFVLFATFFNLDVLSYVKVMDRLEDDPFLTTHYPFVFLDNQIFYTFAVQFRVVVLLLVELLLDVSYQQVLAEPRME